MASSSSTSVTSMALIQSVVSSTGGGTETDEILGMISILERQRVYMECRDIGYHIMLTGMLGGSIGHLLIGDIGLGIGMGMGGVVGYLMNRNCGSMRRVVAEMGTVDKLQFVIYAGRLVGHYVRRHRQS